MTTAAGQPSRANDRRARLAFLLVLTAILGLRSTLVLGFPLSIRELSVDDGLYLRSAQSIVEGRWLGDYDENTLAKAPGMPLLMAGFRVVGLPFRLGQEFLFVVGALLAAAALRSAETSRRFTALAVTIAAFSPAAFTEEATRVLREPTHTALMLIFSATLVLGVIGRRKRGRLLAGLAVVATTAFLSVFREESLWLVAPLGLAAVLAVRLNPKRLVETTLLAAGTVIAVLGSRAWVQAQNEHHYGVGVVHELSEPAFVSAVDGLIRAQTQGAPHTPIRQETLTALYALSPRLASLQADLDGPAFRLEWSVDERGDRIANMTSWALRHAAAAAGHHRSAKDARSFYAALAGELHGACELGRHACLPRHDRLVPRVRPSDLPVALRHALDFMTLAVWPGSRIKGPVFPLEEGDVATVARSRAFLREPRPDLQHWPRYHRIWQGLSSGVSRILPIFGLGLLIGLGLGLMRRDRTSTAALIVGGVIVTRLLLMAMVRAVYIPGAQPYLLCVLPLVPFAGTLGLIALSRRWRRPRLVGIVSVGLTIAVLGLIAWPVPSWLEDLRSLPDGVPRSFWHAIQDEPALVTTHGLLARNDDRLVADPDRSPAYRALRVRLLRRFRQLPTRVRLRGQIHGFQPGTTLFLRWRGADASGLDEGMVQAKPHPDGRFELPMPKALTTLEGFELLISSMSSTSWVVLEPGPIGR